MPIGTDPERQSLLSPDYLLSLLDEVVEEVRIVDLGLDLYTKIEAVLNLAKQNKETT
jgi:hypothetical protein